MEIRQLEYFITACERGSLNRAAECLYTSQPNVSKVISSLERELGRPLFSRTSRGIRLTPYGETVREYAQRILQNAALINSLAAPSGEERLRLSTYPSNMIAHLLVDFYRAHPDGPAIEHYQGTVEEITENVRQGVSELGIVYVAQKQLQAFQHILNHKKLKFVSLATKQACVYVGPKHPLYAADSIDFADLPALRFVRGVRDFFSMEHHLEHISVGAISTEKLRYAAYTNSDHLTIDLLLRSDVCSLGIDFMFDKYAEYDIKALPIQHCEPFLQIGYVFTPEQNLTDGARWVIERFTQML